VIRFELRRLSPEDGRDVYDMLQEIPSEENGFVNGVRGLTYEAYRDWLVRADAVSRQEGIADGWRVPQLTFWLYADGAPAGMCKLRTILTDKLLEEGGSIGYAVRPSRRGKGYGKAMLGLLLEEARALGLEKVLVTIHRGNEPSRRMALGCGFVLERETESRLFMWRTL